MSRSLSFGYNGAVAVSDLVIDRLVRALFDDETVDSTFSSTIGLSAAQTGAVHVLLTQPAVDVTVPGRPDRVRLAVEVHAVFQLPPEGVLGVHDRDWIRARVSITPRVTISNGEMAVDIAALAPADVQIESFGSNNPTVTTLAPAFLNAELHRLIGASDLTRLGAPFALRQETLLSDSYDVVAVEGPRAADPDQLVFAAYDSSNTGETRGQPASIGPMLDWTKSHDSLAVRVSSDVIDALIKDSLDATFMRFDLRLGDTQSQQRRRISWGKETVWTFAGHLKKEETGRFYLRVHPDGRRANLRGVTVTNLRTGEARTFDTNQYGSVNWLDFLGFPGLSRFPVVFDDLQAGDILRFRGEYRTEKATRIYYPSFTLRDGHVELAGRVVRDVACYDDVEVDLKIALFLVLDPATGRIRVRAGDPDIDLPWYVDIGVGFLKAFTSVVAGPFAGLIFGDIDAKIKDAVTGGTGEEIAKLLPGLPENDYLRVFFESIEVRSTGLVIGGQVEAGWLASGGRQEGLTLVVDRNGHQDYQLLTVNPDQRAAHVVRYTGGTAIPDAHSRLINCPSEWGDVFEEFDSSKVRDIVEDPHAYMLAPIATGGTLKLPAPVEGTVLLVRTAWDRIAKVRVDRAEDRTWVLRWISYRTRPSASAVEISGTWTSDAKTVKSAMGTWTDVHNYDGSFRLVLTELYADYGLSVSWTYEGPGDFEVSADQRSAALKVNVDDLPDVSFTGMIMVEVEDIFGRTASAVRVVAGSKSFGDMGPAFEWSADIDEMAIELHGPGPVALPVEASVLVAQLQRHITRLNSRLSQIEAQG